MSDGVINPAPNNGPTPRGTKGHESTRRVDEKQDVELILKDEVYAIVGAAIEVHRELRSGFLESVYQEAMELECRDRGVPFEAQKVLTVRYKQYVLRHKFTVDLVCFGSVIVELKAVEALNKEHEAQLLNYLRATGIRVGVLINFGRSGRLEWKRLIV